VNANLQQITICAKNQQLEIRHLQDKISATKFQKNVLDDLWFLTLTLTCQKWLIMGSEPRSLPANGVYNYDRFYVERRNIGELRSTNNEVLLFHFEPPKFNIKAQNISLYTC